MSDYIPYDAPKCEICHEPMSREEINVDGKRLVHAGCLGKELAGKALANLEKAIEKALKEGERND